MIIEHIEKYQLPLREIFYGKHFFKNPLKKIYLNDLICCNFLRAFQETFKPIKLFIFIKKSGLRTMNKKLIYTIIRIKVNIHLKLL